MLAITFDSHVASTIVPAPMNLLINLLSVFFVLVALLMVLVILMQRPKSEGLGAAFGGAVTENIFGAQTTNVLVKFTTWLAGIFFALTLGLSILYAHRGTGGESAFRRELMKQQAATATSPAPAAKPSPVSSQPSTPLQQTSPATSGSPTSAAGVSPSQGATSPARSPESSPKPNP
jgi:preprotein translocase subunit SecG